MTGCIAQKCATASLCAPGSQADNHSSACDGIMSWRVNRQLDQVRVQRKSAPCCARAAAAAFCAGRSLVQLTDQHSTAGLHQVQSCSCQQCK